MKKALKVLKDILLAPFIIYIYNLLASPLNLVIPINLITILIVGLLSVPGLITLIVLFLIIL